MLEETKIVKIAGTGRHDFPDEKKHKKYEEEMKVIMDQKIEITGVFKIRPELFEDLNLPVEMILSLDPYIENLDAKRRKQKQK